MLYHILPGVFLFGLLLSAHPVLAQGGSNQQGMLTCRTSPSIGLLIGSTQTLACQFRANSGWTQNYVGRMNRIGLDIGITAGAVMAWAVPVSSNAMRPGVLAGRFVGPAPGCVFPQNLSISP